jgi:hypothetical protein
MDRCPQFSRRLASVTVVPVTHENGGGIMLNSEELRKLNSINKQFVGNDLGGCGKSREGFGLI